MLGKLMSSLLARADADRFLGGNSGYSGYVFFDSIQEVLVQLFSLTKFTKLSGFVPDLSGCEEERDGKVPPLAIQYVPILRPVSGRLWLLPCGTVGEGGDGGVF